MIFKNWSQKFWINICTSTLRMAAHISTVRCQNSLTVWFWCVCVCVCDQCLTIGCLIDTHWLTQRTHTDRPGFGLVLTGCLNHLNAVCVCVCVSLRMDSWWMYLSHFVFEWALVHFIWIYLIYLLFCYHLWLWVTSVQQSVVQPK